VGAWAGFNHDWSSGQVDVSGRWDQVSGVWRGAINFQAGTYVFHTVSDDGVELNVSGFGNIISNWTDHPSTQNNSSSIALPTGSRNVQLRWYENGGGAVIRLWWDFTPPALALPAPTLNTPATTSCPVGPGVPKLSLLWTASSGATEYHILRCTGATCTLPAIDTASPYKFISGTSYLDAGIVNAQTYKYQIVAHRHSDNAYAGSNILTTTAQCPSCSDGIDNDGDGLIDSLDPSCFTNGVYNPNKTSEAGPADFCEVNPEDPTACLP